MKRDEEHPDPYNYSRLYGEDGLKRKRDGEDEEIALFHVRTPKYRRVSRVSAVRGAKDGGTVDADRRRLIDEQWAAWRRKRDQKPSQGLGAKEEPAPPTDDRSWLKKVWDNPYGKTAIITAGTALVGVGLDKAMSKSSTLAGSVERAGANLRQSRVVSGFRSGPEGRYPVTTGSMNLLTRGPRGALGQTGAFMEWAGGRHMDHHRTAATVAGRGPLVRVAR